MSRDRGKGNIMTEISGDASVQRLDRSRKRHAAFPLRISTSFEGIARDVRERLYSSTRKILLDAADDLAGEATIYVNVYSDLVSHESHDRASGR